MFCIVLRGSRRRRNVEAEFSRVGLDVEIVERERDEDGKRGCFESHQEVMRIALDRKLDSFAVFEDDVYFNARSHSLKIKGIVEEAVALVSTNRSVVLGLGGLVVARVGRSVVEGSSLFRTAEFACTHAYVVSSSVAQEIVSWKYDGRHVDHVLMERFSENMAMVVPSIAFQAGYFSGQELTTTDGSLWYKLLTVGRNVVSAFVVQVALETFFRAVGKLFPSQKLKTRSTDSHL